MCWVMPPASRSAMRVSRMASSSVVLPWSTWPMTVTTGARGTRSSGFEASVSTWIISSSKVCIFTSAPNSRAIIVAVSVSSVVLIVIIIRRSISFLSTSLTRTSSLSERSLTVMPSASVMLRVIGGGPAGTCGIDRTRRDAVAARAGRARAAARTEAAAGRTVARRRRTQRRSAGRACPAGRPAGSSDGSACRSADRSGARCRPGPSPSCGRESATPGGPAAGRADAAPAHGPERRARRDAAPAGRRRHRRRAGWAAAGAGAAGALGAAGWAGAGRVRRGGAATRDRPSVCGAAGSSMRSRSVGGTMRPTGP